MKKVQSTCNYCSLACNIDYMVEENKIVKVIPTKGYPVNNGFSCIKGLNLDKQHSVYKANPLPRIKKEDGTTEQVAKTDNNGEPIAIYTYKNAWKLTFNGNIPKIYDVDTVRLIKEL